ncbi:hypothetical protein BKA70DRAFT_1270663, partial [Coprinopsis sp. MPI-PUGE-AT-0042]
MPTSVLTVLFLETAQARACATGFPNTLLPPKEAVPFKQMSDFASSASWVVEGRDPFVCILGRLHTRLAFAVSEHATRDIWLYSDKTRRTAQSSKSD